VVLEQRQAQAVQQAQRTQAAAVAQDLLQVVLELSLLLTKMLRKEVQAEQ
jgi:hypothetical protein